MTARSASMLRGGWRSSSSPTPFAASVARLFFLPWPQVRSVCWEKTGEQETGRGGDRSSAADSNLLLLSCLPLSCYFAYASAATVGTTHTLSSPSTSLE